jgi:hypothetical protein
MRKIYSGAESVISWFGKGDSHSDLAMDQIQQVLGRRELSAEDCRWWRGDVHKNLSQQSCWTGLWIVQEFALALEIKVLWGRKQLQTLSNPHLRTFSSRPDQSIDRVRYSRNTNSQVRWRSLVRMLCVSQSSMQPVARQDLHPSWVRPCRAQSAHRL